jgi:hypothetical protein
MTFTAIIASPVAASCTDPLTVTLPKLSAEENIIITSSKKRIFHIGAETDKPYDYKRKKDTKAMYSIDPTSEVKLVKSVTVPLYNLTHGINKGFN